MLSFDTNGSGHPLLLLHGALVSRAMWHPQLEAFAKHFRVITCDLPAHGASADLPEVYTVAEVAREVSVLLDTLKVERLHVCGHSLGGMVAQHLAATQARRVEKIVLAETAFGTKASFLERVQTALAGPLLKLMSPRMLVSAAVGRYGSLHPEVGDFIRQEMSTYGRGTIARVMAAAIQYDGKAALADIQASTLVLVAAENKQTHVQGHELARLIPDARLVVVPEAHHLVNLDNSGFFNDVVLNFLRG